VAAAAALVVAGIAAFPQSQATPTFAYVSTDLILEQTPGYAEADSIWRQELVGWRQEVQRLQQRFDSAASAFDQQSIVLSATAREEKVQELQQLQGQLNTRTQELQVRAEQRRAELVGPLEDRIQRVIDGIRAERNLSVIFDVAAPGNNIISADQRIDLTGLVIQRLNAAGGP
jgi:Skp family chaperone for outer membrane proteins